MVGVEGFLFRPYDKCQKALKCPLGQGLALIEVLSGVGLGAFWIPESQTLFLSGWASAPDVGVSRSFGLLGFEVAEDAELDGDPMPVEALNLQLSEGPVMPQIHHLSPNPPKDGVRTAEGGG